MKQMKLKNGRVIKVGDRVAYDATFRPSVVLAIGARVVTIRDAWGYVVSVSKRQVRAAEARKL
jgi:hypothetical protein